MTTAAGSRSCIWRRASRRCSSKGRILRSRRAASSCFVAAVESGPSRSTRSGSPSRVPQFRWSRRSVTSARARYSASPVTARWLTCPARIADSSLVWIDRTGKSTPALTARGSFQSPRLSPDGTRVILSVVEEPNGTDLWMYEFARGTRLRLTTNGRSRRTVWSPDGQRLAFYSTPETGDQDLFVVPSAGGEPARLLERPRAQYPSSWSPDGRFLLFEEIEAATQRRDVWVLPADESPKPVIVTGFYERGAVFSPDGRHIAYVSDESGRPEVYVQPFPGPGPKVAVSLNGGLQPVWSRDGKELFYREDDWLVAAAVQPSPFRVLSAQTARRASSGPLQSRRELPRLRRRGRWPLYRCPSRELFGRRDPRRAELARRVETARAHALNQLAKTDERRCPHRENGSGASGEIDGPVEQLKPINWLIRNVRPGANKWASNESPEGAATA